MRSIHSIAMSVAALAVASTAVFWDMTVQAQSGGRMKAQPKQVTVVGCVQREADYRHAHDKGRGGAVGTGLGVENEYVLINATASGLTAETAFELTGSNEGTVGQYVGQRVEITGMLKRAETGPAGPTGGGTAGKPPKGVDVSSRDLRLRELEVMTVRAISGSCPAS